MQTSLEDVGLLNELRQVVLRRVVGADVVGDIAAAIVRAKDGQYVVLDAISVIRLAWFDLLQRREKTQQAKVGYLQVNENHIGGIGATVCAEAGRSLEVVRDAVVGDSTVHRIVAVGPKVVRRGVSGYQVDYLASGDGAKRVIVAGRLVSAHERRHDGVDADVALDAHGSDVALLAGAGLVQLVEERGRSAARHFGNVEQGVPERRHDEEVVVGEGALVHIEPNPAGV